MYVYSADIWCESCGRAIIDNLHALNHNGSHVDTGDSDDWPQWANDDEALDAPQHCAGASKCLEAIELTSFGLDSDARLYGAEAARVGALLNDELTEHGVGYLGEMLAEPDPTPYQSALHTLWREMFATYL